MLSLTKPTLCGLLILLSGILLWFTELKVGLFDANALSSTAILITKESTKESTDESAGFPMVLIDPTGEEIILQKPPERIISVTLGTDEILHELVDHRRIVAVTNLVDNPQLSNIPNVYPPHIKRISSEVESILALEPDLVFIGEYTQADTVRLLLNAQVPVVRLAGGNTFSHIENNIKVVGKVTGTDFQATTLLNSLKHTKDTHQKLQSSHKQSPPRVLYYNLNGYSSGQNTTIDEIITLAGGHNVMRETGLTGIQKISAEMAMGLEPDVILMRGWSMDSKLDPAQTLKKLPAWQNVNAVKNNRVYGLKGAWVLSVSQYSWDGIQQVSELLIKAHNPNKVPFINTRPIPKDHAHAP